MSTRDTIEEMVAGHDGRETMTLGDTMRLIEVLADSLDEMKKEMAVTHTIIDPTDLNNTIDAVLDIGLSPDPVAYAEKLDGDDDSGDDKPKPKPKPKPAAKPDPEPAPSEGQPDMTPPQPEEQPEPPEEGLPGMGEDQRIIVGVADAGAKSQT